MIPRGLVLRAPGTNCHAETQRALEQAGAASEIRPWAALGGLDGVDIVAIPGGFTYGDDLGAGRILGAEIRARFLDVLSGFVARGGLMIGICNGFQVLVESGLLPASISAPGGARGEAALIRNDSGRFECGWTLVLATTDRTPWLVKGETYRLPVAHGEGKFVARPDCLEAMAAQGQIALRYAAPPPRADAGFPANPSGSTDGIAGVIDPSGRIFGLMPHPERHALPWHSPDWGAARSDPGEPDGLRMFRHAVEAVRG